MDVTIYDIAEQAEVSIATVSRVFNGYANVSKATRKRVLEVAETLGYQPNVSARSLARRNSHLISAVIPVITNDFYMGIMRGMQDALAESGYDLLVYASHRAEEVDDQLARATQKGRSEGLLLVSVPPTDTHVKHLKRSKQSIVLVDAFHHDFDSISVDNRKGGYLATRHLIKLGHERIAHITVTPEPPPAKQRREGFEEALREAGLPIAPSLIASCDKRPHAFVEEAGYESMKELLEQKPLPTAVFAASDVQALGAMRALQEKGLSVPDDMALVGFDDIQVCHFVGLTTLRQPVYEMGKLAIEKLLLRMEDPDRPVSHTVFSPQLVARQTCSARTHAARSHRGVLPISNS